jgi:hypothetical protein
MMSRLRALIYVNLAAVVLAVSGCGGGGGGLGSDDPASLAPADSPIYIQGVLRPRGRLKAKVESLASTITRLDDPTAKLIDLVDQGLRESHPLSGKRLTFAKDVEPWLGQRAGIFVRDFADRTSAAGIVQTTDPQAARRFLDDSEEKGDKESSYRSVHYLIDGGDGTAAGLVGKFMVIGTQKGFKAAVDVSKGDEDPLGEEGRLTDTLDEASSGSLVDAYFDLERVTDAIRANNRQGAQGLEGAIGDTSGKTALASLVPSSDSAELDISTNASRNVQFADLSSLIESLPADSFATIGVSDLGGRIERAINQLEGTGIAGIGRTAIDQQLAVAGLNLDDITSALGDLAVFAKGADKGSLQGAGVITTDDPAAARKLVNRLTELALRSGQSGISRASVGTGFSVRDADLGRQPLTITTDGKRIAIGYGKQATEQALSAAGGRTLADDPTYKQAVDALGGGGIFGYVSLPKVFQLADALGAIRDPGYQQVRPYLHRLSYAVLGSGEQGDRSTSKIIVGVRR